MPTAQPTKAIEAMEKPLLKAYADAWERVIAEQQSLETEPLKWRRRARLAEMQQAIEKEMTALDRKAAEWIAERVPQIYSMGIKATAADLGTKGPVVWSAIQQEAVETLALDLFEDLLKATAQVNQTTKNLVRRIARDEVLQKMIAGDTAVAAGRRMARILKSNGIHAVTYSNGAKHGLKEYSQMAVRTKTAVAYNSGVLGGAPEVGFFEVFDGTGCGWTKHDDPDLAHGKVVTRDSAAAHPISHPGCRRAFGARPDLDPPVKERPASRRPRESQPADATVKAATRPGVTPKPTPAPSPSSAYYPPAIDKLPRLAGPDTIEGTLKATNPLYKQVLGYDLNCAHVVAAQELRRRGFDVQAASIGTGKARAIDDAFDRWVDPDTGKPAPWKQYKTATDKDMLNATKEWPEGGRGFVAVGFRMGGGHVFSVEKVKDKLRFIDAQNGREVQFMDYGQLANQSVVMRVDNLDPTDKVREYVDPAGTGPKAREVSAEELAKEKARDDFAAMMNASAKPKRKRR